MKENLKRQISRELNIDRKTIRRYLRNIIRRKMSYLRVKILLKN